MYSHSLLVTQHQNSNSFLFVFPSSILSSKVKSFTQKLQKVLKLFQSSFIRLKVKT